MPFDPSQPFEAVEDRPAFDESAPYEAVAVAEFDPSKPFEPVDEPQGVTETTEESHPPGLAGSIPAPATPDRSFTGSIRQAVDQPLEAMGITAEVFGMPRVGAALRGAVEKPEAFQPATERFLSPKPGDPNIAGFNLTEMPRALVEQFGQVVGSVAMRAVGTFLGGAAGGRVAGPKGAAVGAAAGGFAGPFLFEAMQIAGPVAMERARRNGRAEPSVVDITAALTTAAGSGALNAIGARYLPGGAGATKNIMARIVKAMIAEGATEGGQALTEQVGESAGTETGLEIRPREALGEALLGAGEGGAISAIPMPAQKPTVESVQQATDAELETAKAEAEQMAAPNAEAEALPVAAPEPTVETTGAPEIAAAERTPATEPMSEGPGAAAATEFPEQGKVGAYNAAVDAQRAERGREPLMSRAREANPDTWDKAVERIEQNPDSPEQLVERIHEDPKRAVSRDEQAELLWRMTDLRNKLEMEAERAADGNSTPEEQALAQERAEGFERQLQRTEEADRLAGTAQGAALQFRQVLANEDYTFGGIMMRARKQKGDALTAEERSVIKKQADEIASLQTKVAEGEQSAARTQVLEATIADLQKQPRFGKEVFDIARGIVDRWKTEANVARGNLAKRLGRTSAGVDPTILVDVAKIIRAKIGELGLDFAETSTALLAEFGEGIQPYLQKGWVKAQQMIGKEKAPPRVRDAIKEGVAKPAKGEKTPVDVRARAKAEASAKMELSNRTAYEAVRAVINSGVKGELEIMNGALNLLKEAYPDLTLEKLDVAFSEYGKAKYPSTEATKVELAKLRRLRQMQAAIEDVKRRGETSKSGVQRAKADADVRNRQKELKDAIEEYGREVPTTPEQLANKERARLSRAENAIADLDRELRTGEARIKAEPKMPSKELEQLQSELAAMRELKKEIEDAKNPPKTAEEKYNEFRAKGMEKQLTEAERRIREGDFAPRAKKVAPELTKENLDLKAKLEAKKNEVRRGEERFRLAQRTKMQRVWDGIKQTKQAFVNIISSLDLSAPRQGLIYLLGASTRVATRPGMIGRPFRNMIQALFSKAGADRIRQRTEARINRKNGVDKMSGVQFQEYDNTRFTRGEENAHSILDEWANESFRTGSAAKTAARALPLAGAKAVHASNRAFVTFLNSARAELLDHLLEVNFKDRPPTPAEIKAVGDMVNLATGRSNMNPKVASALGYTGLWSPNLLISRLQTLTGQPLVGSIARGEGRAAKIVAKEYARVIAGGYLLYTISQLFNEDKEKKKSTSSDFGKIIRKGEGGDTRVDLWAGFQQQTVLAERFRTAETTDLSGKTRKADLMLTGAKFIRSKLRPDVGIAADILLRKNYKGDKTTLSSVAKSAVPIPLSMQELVPLLKAHGLGEAAALEAIQMFGAGVSNYADDAKAEKAKPR